MSHFILPEKTRQSCWILKLPIFTPRIQSEENEAAADEDEDEDEEEEEEEEDVVGEEEPRTNAPRE